MHTDEGICGWGEPVVEGKAKSVEAAVQEMGNVLIGQNPLEIERLWQTMYRGSFYRGGPVLASAISGIEHALWDIKGKYHGLPVYEMLGGACRSKVRMYAHCRGDSNEEIAEEGLRLKEKGFTAIKIGVEAPVKMVDNYAYIKNEVEKWSMLRQAVGDEMDIALDLHGRLSPAMSIRLAQALEPYYPLFFEEPCLPENVDALARIAQSTTIPIATGERLYTRWGFREVLEKQAAVIVQPDLCHAGGILESKKIAAMAEVYYAGFAPHNPLGPVSLAACLQVDACTPNFLIQEHPTLDEGWDLGEGYLKEPFNIVDGYIELTNKPGLGIEVDEEFVRKQQFAGDWQTPLLYHEDGSLGDW